MAIDVTWALKMRGTGLYLTTRDSLVNMTDDARRFRTVVGAADYRARNHPSGPYAIVRLTKRSGVDLMMHRLVVLLRRGFAEHIDLPP